MRSVAKHQERANVGAVTSFRLGVAFALTTCVVGCYFMALTTSLPHQKVSAAIGLSPYPFLGLGGGGEKLKGMEDHEEFR